MPRGAPSASSEDGLGDGDAQRDTQPEGSGRRE
eukprot:CAMPEP_0177398198 /NCGR_PEP_ID=MMETSP0368-20130122/57765_1 /TAXON_ID=447022 ORGANISM="Scrippsiella hangoei-like, Strain SHHI-4" /NCGR_SAMPLE_ID=MMETSP0368 /ASSEMBLY_ACC=CAM_ASM_000363 /LENGTH=32 /DNA_ID= /DNA_START= /DNA_END= /DNA_ORIENTATION=